MIQLAYMREAQNATELFIDKAASPNLINRTLVHQLGLQQLNAETSMNIGA